MLPAGLVIHVRDGPHTLRPFDTDPLCWTQYLLHRLPGYDMAELSKEI